MSAHRIPTDLYDMLANSMATVKDPGAGGTIVVGTKGIAICEVVTAAAESRVLEDADNLPVGAELKVMLKTDGGDLTVASDDTSVVLKNVGEYATFVVSPSGSGKVWKSNDAGTDLPASAGTYAFLATPSAADNLAGLFVILDALEAAGLIDRTNITQA